jgi:glycerophosphoryl diester phosphodiesterase/predicted amidohydrolase
MLTRVALLQPRYPEEATEASARACVQWMLARLDEMRPGGADLVLLPEYSTSPGLEGRAAVRSFSQAGRADFRDRMAAHARRLGAWISWSSYHLSADSAVNRTFLLAPGGELRSYDKVHLTETESVGLGLVPGPGPVVEEAVGTRVGFMTCFDAYFAEYAEALAALGARLVLHPSYQRSESAARIRLLCAARAMDSGAYIARASYARPGAGTGGHSLLAAPDGTILADQGDEAGVLFASIDVGLGFSKPAAHGLPLTEHRSLLESMRRPTAYRPHIERVRALSRAPFPRVCAHRGIPSACPENTLPSFGAAIAAGAQEIELDLWLSSDGAPVVCHDGDLFRTTGRRARISELPWEEIRRLDASEGRDAGWRGARVPRLEEVLDLAGARVGLNIHLKEPGPEGRLVALVARLLRERGLEETAYIAGEESVLEAAAGLCPGIARACLAQQANPEEQVRVAGRYSCARVQFGRSATDAALAQARERGLVRNLFYADEPGEARAWVRRGIDVVLTNCAHRVASADLRG